MTSKFRDGAPRRNMPPIGLSPIALSILPCWIITLPCIFGVGGEFAIAENRSILHHAKLFRETLLSFSSSFQTVSQTFGLWWLDIFTKDAKLKYNITPPAGEQYKAVLQAMHMFIIMMMFMSLALSLLLSIMQ
jgi:hypothetical protein